MEFYIVEYYENDIVTAKRFKAENSIKAVSEFYSYLNYDRVGTKCISKADTVEEAVEIFNRFDHNNINIINIYTIGNWVYCTEVADEG